MKKILSIIMILSNFIFFGQVQKIHFDYDVSGNQITREFCLTCLAKSPADQKEITELKDADLLKFQKEDDFSYYPNPVKEELFLTWNNSNEVKLQDINLYSINGTLLKSFKNNKALTSHNIQFNEFPIGVYLIKLIYNDGNEKTIKIIKQ